MSLLQLSNVTVSGTLRQRLDNVNLSLDSAQLVGVIGANGAGKTTLLQVIAGLLSDCCGHVFVNGKTLKSLPTKEQARVMAYLPQHDMPQWDISVSELLEIGLLQHRLGKTARSERIVQVMGQCDLVTLANRRVSTLSGGERQRALLARALVGEPHVLLCDEPTAALDIKHQLDTMTLLKKRAHRGQLIVCCLHDLALAARFCDQLVLLQEGQLVDVGTPANVLSEQHLARAFGITAQWICNDSGVAWIPQPL